MARVVESSPPPRRVTRSQSRELETSGYQKPNAFAAKGNGGFPMKGESKADRLSIVAEESPAKSRATLQEGNTVVPQSPETHEGNSKLSGTTFLNQESENDDEDQSEDEELNALSVVDELPDLQHAAVGFLNMLISGSSDPISMVTAAKRLKDPKQNVEKKRLKTHSKKLVDRMKHFTAETYIDVGQIERLVPTVTSPDSDQSWSPSPILHSANCARLALEVFLATAGSDSSKQTVRNLETHFPTPFLNRMDRGPGSTSVGTSAAQKATFDLALEIRTQFAIMELDRRSNEADFDPVPILRGVFYDDLALDSDEPEPGYLRGFKLAGTFEDENGRLPDRYQDDVANHYAELEHGLSDDDGSPNIKALAAAYPWSRFLLRTARFVHAREREIKRDLQTQPDFDEIQALVVRQIKLRDDPDSLSTSERRASTVPRSGEHSARRSLTWEDRDSSRGQHISATPELLRERGGAPIAGPGGGSPRSLGQPTPVSNRKEPVAQETHRRKSGKNFNDQQSLRRLWQRMRSPKQREVSSLDSQPTSESTGGYNATTAQAHSPKSAPNEEREEVPESPQDNNTSYADFADDATLNPQEDFDIRGHVDESTSPPGSARINQVSHNGLFFDSPSRAHNHSQPSSQRASQNDQTPRRNIFDRQNDARRVSPINLDTDSQRTQIHSGQSGPTASRKRQRSASLGESSEDAFDRDERAGDDIEERQRMRQAREERRVRQRTETTDETGPERQLQQSLAASSQRAPPRQAFTSSQSNTVPSTAPPAPVSTAARPSWTASTSQAAPTPRTAWDRHNTVPADTSYLRSQLHLGRLKWTPEEDERLIMLIQRWGPSWAKIESEDALCPPASGGPKFRHRENMQVKLKDRARNLKKLYIREGRPLPPNFDRVTG